MIGAVTTIAGDRAWRIGAYALATLVHVPLIVAVQQFGDAIAAPRPVESVITLLDTPETARLRIVEAGSGRADAVTQTVDTLRAAPSSATRLDGPVTATALAPTPSSSATADLGGDALSIASVIASQTLSPSAVTDASPAVASVEATATADTVDVAPSASPAIAAPAAAPEVTVSTAPRMSGTPSVASATATPSIARTTSAVTASNAKPVPSTAATSPSAAASVAVASSASSAPITPSTATVVAPDVIASNPAASAAVTPSAASPAQPLPRIAIPATSHRTASSTVTATSPVAASPVSSGGGSGSAVSPAVAASAARVTTALPSAPMATRTAGAVVAPSITAAPSAARSLPGATPVRPAPVRPTPIEPAPRIAALPADTATTGPDREALNAFVRGYGGGGCFAALTIASGDSGLGIAGFSRDESELAGFEDALGKRTGPRPAAAARRVSEAQCAALAFARSQAAYPDFPVRLTLRPDTIESGATIAGRIVGAGDRPLTMLILDDEGRIQDASFLLSRESNGDWAFETPLSLTGDPVPTVQLFVALAGTGPISTMRPPVPVEARRYFAEIDRLLKARSQTLDVALAAFTVGKPASAGTP